jgi:DNA-binding NarL/FixJ family response regulator
MDVNAPMLFAISDRALGSVQLAEGEAGRALQLLRRSLAAFREIDAPYDEARVHFLIAQACQNQNDCDTAEMEIESARRIFLKLGALPDLESVDTFIKNNKKDPQPGPLTRREVEVLSLVAFGKTNRDIAENLFISEKTVARHLSNIFTKLGLSSRSAATAYAFQNHLV